MSKPRSCPLDEHGAVFKESDSTLTMPSAPSDWGGWGGGTCLFTLPVLSVPGQAW